MKTFLSWLIGVYPCGALQEFCPFYPYSLPGGAKSLLIKEVISAAIVFEKFDQAA